MRAQLNVKLKQEIIAKVKNDRQFAGTQDIVVESALSDWFGKALGSRRKGYRTHSRLPYAKG